MDQGNTNLLTQLRDIHGASDPGWWPPAPGWWFLLAIGLVVLALFLRYGFRRWLVLSRRRRLLTALEKIGTGISATERPQEYLANMNRLFRVVALRAFPGTACARLQGNEWVQFIQSLMPEGVNSDGLAALASGPYEPRPDFDTQGLDKLARTWVAKYG